MSEPACRACGGHRGTLVLDLGEQPACDYFPRLEDPGPDPVYPLQMWLCSSCGLAQLLADPTVPEEPKGSEPEALVAQAADAVERVAMAGLLPDGGRVAEYGSPHGGSWLGLLQGRGLTAVRCGAGRCGPRLFRPHAQPGPVCGTEGENRPRRPGRRDAAPIPLARHHRPPWAVERPASWALRVLLN